MFVKAAHSHGVVFLRSTLLEQTGAAHAFSTRIGGVSVGAFEAFNLGPTSPDTPEPDAIANIQTNYRRLQSVIGCGLCVRAWARQVHGSGLFVVDSSNAGTHPDADGLLTMSPDVLVGVRTADCVPVLLASSKGEAVAAVHAGWRGLVAGVIPASVSAFEKSFGIGADGLVAAVGPCIGVARYEVGPEVAGAFEQAKLEAAIRRGSSRPHIDLSAAAVLQLAQAGLPDDAIDEARLCTFDHPQWFYSHRRDGPRTGRMAAVIALA